MGSDPGDHPVGDPSPLGGRRVFDVGSDSSRLRHRPSFTRRSSPIEVSSPVWERPSTVVVSLGTFRGFVLKTVELFVIDPYSTPSWFFLFLVSFSESLLVCTVNGLRQKCLYTKFINSPVYCSPFQSRLLISDHFFLVHL